MSNKKKIGIFRRLTMTMKEFERGAKKSTLFQDVARDIARDGDLIDELNAKRNRDWSILANQSVTNPIY